MSVSVPSGTVVVDRLKIKKTNKQTTFFFAIFPPCGTYSVGLDISLFHLCQEVSWGELELILQVNLQQGVVVTNIKLCTWGGQCA